MNRIHVLDQLTANSIAAGEVIERPASVVKELVENALDAAASVINIEIRQGGIGLIRVTDNGSGMNKDDACLAFGRHATSKLRQIEDLDSLTSMGFRGEALASIAAVARVRLETREPDAPEGAWLMIEGGELLDSGKFGGPAGTSISVENLFFNVPARYKFLRKDATEAGAVTDVLERLALARPDVSFRLVSNQQEVLHTPGNNDLMSTVYAIYGKQTALACLPVEGQIPPLKISGLVGRPDAARSSRSQQNFFVNGRLVRARQMTAALDEAYQTMLMKGQYAFALLFLEIPPQLVDVNVHPQKMEVRFWNDSEVFRAVYHAVQNALQSGSGIPGAPTDDESQKPVETAGEPAPNQQLPVLDPQSPIPEEPVVLETYPLPEKQPLHLAEPVGQEVREEPPLLLKINDLQRGRLIGQLFLTYLLVELDQELLLIDQHAAHEKIIFEGLLRRRKLAKQQNQPENFSQSLLVPQILEISRSEIQFLKQKTETFRDLGFEFDFFGDSSIALRSVPAAGKRSLLPGPAFRLALDTLMAEPLNNEGSIEDFYYTMACKAAVKAHDRLDAGEIDQLLQDLSALENPYQCPHGRPVIIRLSRRELEKRFRRIV
ncbi:MAG TPA: DNA mismatch repair endonuclease MutL [Clostridiales bacterium]|nr:DNA mismatch repair endonuclease MutL [Clostridiales bacterium]